MKRTTKFEWHGNAWVLLILCVSIVLIPFALIHFITSLVMIEHDEPDAKSDQT